MKASATLSILVLVLLAAFVTNPNEDKHREAVADYYAKVVGIDGDGFLYDALSTVVTKYVVEVDNYYVFSITRMGGQPVGVGLFTRNIIFTDRLTKKLQQ